MFQAAIAQGLAVLREALANASRHPEATRASVKLEALSGDCQLAIADNGLGFDASAYKRDGLGLTTLRRRAATHQGGLVIESMAAGGTVLRWSASLTAYIDSPGRWRGWATW